jgi:hypothetical protein
MSIIILTHIVFTENENKTKLEIRQMNQLAKIIDISLYSTDHVIFLIFVL